MKMKKFWMTVVALGLALCLGAGSLSAAFAEEEVLEPVKRIPEYVEWLLEGREEYRFLALRSLAVRCLCFLALVVFVRGPEDVGLYALILCLALGGNQLLNLARARIRITCRELHPRRHLKPVLTLMASGLAASLYSKVDISMLNLLANAAQVGFYTTGYKVILMVLTAATALTAVYVPRLSRSTGEAFRRYLSGGLHILLAVTVPASVGLMLVAEDAVLVLFGEVFLPAAAVLKILAPLILIRGCGDLMCYQAIISAGKEGLLIGARLWAGLANIVLNGLLIPKFGCSGAAFASLLSELVVNGILLPRALALGKPELSGKMLLRIFLGTAAMTAVVVTVQQLAEDPMTSLVLAVGLGAVVYTVILGYRNTKTVLEKYHGTENQWENL